MIIDRQSLVTNAHNGLEQAELSVALLAESVGPRRARRVARAISRAKAMMPGLRFNEKQSVKRRIFQWVFGGLCRSIEKSTQSSKP